MKKFLKSLLVLSFIFTMLPMSVMAAEPAAKENPAKVVVDENEISPRALLTQNMEEWSPSGNVRLKAVVVVNDGAGVIVEVKSVTSGGGYYGVSALSIGSPRVFSDYFYVPITYKVDGVSAKENVFFYPSI